MSNTKIFNLYFQKSFLHASYQIALAATSDTKETQLKHIAVALSYVFQHQIKEEDKMENVFQHQIKEEDTMENMFQHQIKEEDIMENVSQRQIKEEDMMENI